MHNIIDIPHPGVRIKAEVIPQGMPVTKAAKLMGVGRPALSNLLNGKAALSVDMAARLEKTFNYPRKDLLKMQADYEAIRADKISTPSDIKVYVPPFLGIKAAQIEQWSENNISARMRFPVLLRTLIHSTGRVLTRVDIPGNDDAERPGWDGIVEAGEGTPWIPKGRSGWEFGVTKDIKGKADDDFIKSVKTLQPDTTFVFVTPRRWPGKSKWVADAKIKGLWKDIRAYDASDLEQWLEQSLSAQTWFANEANIPAEGIRTLDKCWEDWASVSTPPLTGTLFCPAIEVSKRALLSRLSGAPDKSILISADSTEEALAFLAQIFGELGGEELASYRDRVLVFDKVGVLPRLAQGAPAFIPVVFKRDVERELAPHVGAMHSIVVYPRGVGHITPDIVLEPINYQSFGKALKEMGKSRDEIARLAKESGRSITVLRRRIANVPVVQTPEWAADHKTVESLVPFAFVGAWDSNNETDKHGLSYLAGGREYAELEKEFQRLTQLDDVPVWSIGIYRGIVSKLDLFYAIASAITSDDLNRYFEMARKVLGEDDPALDLEEDKRWAAHIYGKTRKFSASFRKGISETLVLLAVYSHLFRACPDVDTKVCLLVRDLLPTPLTTRVLEANCSDLPTYAEAAPEEFLSIIERDLKTGTPEVFGLMRPMGTGVLGRSSPRVGLLWALELLSWNPATFPRAVFILSQLAQVECNDNLTNKPINSLMMIFRAWMPQTEVGHQERAKLLQTLAERFPDVAWKICVTQFGDHYVDGIGHYSRKPIWRSDGHGAGEPLTTAKPIHDFQREMVEMALRWKSHSLDTLSDLVERLQSLDDSSQIRVWRLIEAWQDKASDVDKAAMREKIRTNVSALASGEAKKVYAKLTPSDLLNKHAWLFRDIWVATSAEEKEDAKKSGFKIREEHIKKMRIDAMREILKQRGFAGLLELARHGKASHQIGIYANDLLSEQKIMEFLQAAFRMVMEEKNNDPVKNLITGVLRAMSDDRQRERILGKIAKGLSEENVARLLLLAPFSKSTWKLVDALGETAQNSYWNEVVIGWVYYPEEEADEGVRRLLEAGRPRAAFLYIGCHVETVDAQLLFRLLSEVAGGGNERPDEYLPDKHNVERAFKHLNASPMLTLEQKANLEFAFIGFLAQAWAKHVDSYGIPNLERHIEAHPEVFIEAVVFAYRREDGGEDPIELRIAPSRRENVATSCSKLLEFLERIPGQGSPDELKAAILEKWIATVRQRCAELSRGEIADFCIGKLLARGPVGKDGVWPCESIRQVMEVVQSEAMMEGAWNVAYNSRGVHMRGEDGTQERELAEKYRKWGQVLQFSHPFVASKLLMQLEKTYEREANREDEDAGIRRRLH